MLLELKVKDFAIIHSVHLHFQEGLNIISGETGAGKSVLLKSLSLLMGGKAVHDSVRTGAEQAVIEGFFDISEREDIQKRLLELGIEQEDHQLVVRRIISSQGKSRIYLNESLTTLQNLQNIVCPLIEVTGQSAPLIEITGQHDNRTLMTASYHLDIVDQYVGALPLRQEYTKAYSQLQKVLAEKLLLETNIREMAQKLDFLTYQRDEIKKLNLNLEEDKNLESEFHRVKNSAKLMDYCEKVQSVLYSDDDSVMVRLQKLIQRSHDVVVLDPSLKAHSEALTLLKTQVEEFLFIMSSYERSLDADPERLNEVEARMSELRRLQRKYGSLEDVVAAFDQLNAEISLLENSDERMADLEKEAVNLKKLLEKLAKDLHGKRKNGSRVLAESVNAELKDLNMKGLHFEVSVAQKEDLGPTGFTELEFMTSHEGAGAGSVSGSISVPDLARPLAKFSSGGELSRILLSLKRVVGKTDFSRTYLFDEVDTGVSGPTAEKVGRKLRDIAKGQQVICVTHLAQVASYGDAHIYIQKKTSSKGVEMEALLLKKDERVNEIARLISGEKISKTSLAHAKELLRESHL